MTRGNRTRNANTNATTFTAGIFRTLFGARARAEGDKRSPRATRLGLEALETRELLAADPTLGAQLFDTGRAAQVASANVGYAPVDLSQLQSEVERSNAVGATWLVTSTGDSADESGTLRYAIAHASPGDVVAFDASLSGATITVGSELLVEKSLTIDGGDNNITLSGGGRSRVVRFLGGADDTYSLTNLTITEGHNTHGAGVYVATGKASIVNCSIVGNTSSTSGGGVYVAGKGALDATNLLIAENSAKYGGGLYAYGAEGNAVVLTNCTITNNNATSSGGGVHTESGAGALEFRNSIIALNTGKPDVQKKNAARVVNAYNTLSTYSAWTNSENALAYDATAPLFVGEGDYSLAEGSQALDQGAPQFVTTSVDLAGAPRSSGASVDLGAYEFQTPAQQLDAPMLAAIDATTNSITVEWDAIANASGYTLQYKRSNVSTWTTASKTIETTISQYTIDNLNAGTNYNFRISANGSDSYASSNYSEVVTYSTIATDETPSTIVTTATDVVNPTDGLISLREAIAYAANGATITFNSLLRGKTITLESELLVEKPLVIDGGAYQITLSGGDATRVIRFFGDAADSYTLRNLTITQGRNTHGAGVYVANGTANLVNLAIVGNTSTTSGGGVYVAGKGALNATNLLIANNSAKYGGGLYAYGADGKSVTLTNCTIVNNNATSSGAGIHTESGAGTLEIRNSIIALNTGKPDVQKKTAARVVNAYNTLSTYSAWTNGLNNLAYNASQPLFFNASQGVYSLAQDSQAFNQGDNSFVSTTTDLAGRTRIVEEIVDLGAYELQAINEAPSTVVTTDADLIDPLDGQISLREALAYANPGETVTFDVALAGKTIAVSDELLIEKSVNIDGGENNITLSGGGTTRIIRLLGAETDEYTIANLTLANGSHERGAAVYVATGKLNLLNSALVDNEASICGGGLYVAGKGELNAVNLLVANNSAKYGGGIYSYGAAGKAVTLTNCTIVNNHATSSGAGLHTESGAGTVEIRNSIIALNTGKSDVQKKTAARVVNAYNTLSSFKSWTNGANNIVYSASKPLFVDAAQGNFTLEQGSQAFNVGDNSFVTTTTDLIGNPRIALETVDLGAYELQSAIESPSTVVTTALDVVNPVDGLISLREAIAYAEPGASVTFDATLSGATITLSAELSVEKSLTIDGEDRNVTVSGGGTTRVLRFQGANSDLLVLKNLALVQGASTQGAGLYVANGSAEVVNVAITDSVATNGGGGVYLAGSCAFTATNMLVANNSAKFGGGLYSYGGAGKNVTLTNCTIVNNAGSTSGAGLHFESGNGVVEIRNSIVALNIGESEIYKKTAERIVNAYNTLANYSEWTSGQNNLAYETDLPLFVSSSDYSLADDSQALNKGNNEFISVETDLAGHRRIIGAIVDLGAYESQAWSETPSTVVTTDLDLVDSADGLVSLREAIAYAGVDEIVTFDPSLAGKTLIVSSELLIEKSVAIDGGENEITVSGGGANRVIRFLGADTDEYAIQNLTITNGAHERGAGVYVATGRVNILNCSIVGNTASIGGGGLYVAGKGELNAINVLIADNSAKYGGGVYSFGAEGKEVALTNCTIANNHATTSGAGIHTESGAGTLEIRNSIIALNTGKSDVQKKTAARAVNAYSTLSTYKSWTNGENNISYDANKSLFVGNGDYALSETSQAINMGDNSFVTLENDLSGGKRVVANIVDLGAYEIQAVQEAPSTVVTLAEDLYDPYDGQISLREALAYAGAGDTITFDATLNGATITLTSELLVEKSVSFDGADLNITLNGGGATRIIRFLGAETDEYTIQNLTLTNGYHERGAALYVATGKANIVNSSLVGNTATIGGGGVYVAGKSELNAINVLIADNSAKYGGGLYSYGADGKEVTLTNCSVTNNNATSSGGGIHTESGAGTLELRNSIVALNTGKPDVQKKTAARAVNAYNTVSTYSAWTNGQNNLLYNAALPLFAGENDYSLAQSSQAFNQGDNTFVTSATDLAGNTRIMAEIVDLGAYELQATPEAPSLVVTTTSDVVDPYDQLISLREAVAYAASGETITFDAALTGETILLNSELNIEKSITLDGGARLVALSGNAQTRVVRFSGAETDLYVVRNLTIMQGASSDGAGAYVESGKANLINCYVVSNTSTNNGGGVYVAERGELVAVNLLVANNTAVDGGGIYSYGASNKSVEIINCTIVSNTASNSGSGLHLESGDGNVEIANSIIALNSGADDLQKKTSARVVNGYSSLSTFTGWAISSNNIVYDESSVLFMNAELGDFTLAPYSVAINAGSNYYVTESTDLVGRTRTSGGIVDLGAYEYQGVNQRLQTPVLTNDAPTDTSVMLRWAAVPGASGYTLQYKRATSLSWTTVSSSLSGADTSYVMTDLTPNVAYNFRLRANGSGLYANSNYSAVVNCTTEYYETPSTVVTTALDVVDPSDGVISLREAATVYANSGDFVTFDSSLSGSRIRLTEGSIALNRSVQIDATWLSSPITLDAWNLSRVFTISGQGTSIRLNNINLTSGNSGAENGGAIYASDGATVELRNCSLTSNSGANGGAVYAQEANVTFTSCVFTDNIAQTDGGAIGSSASVALFEDCSFASNKASANGGAIVGDSITIKRSSFTSNASSNGGAIYANGTALAIEGSGFVGNTGLQNGGAIYVASGTAEITGATIQTSDEYEQGGATTGGAIYIAAEGSVTLDDSALSGQSASQGGAVANFGAFSATNSDFIGNSATGSGGALYNTGRAELSDVWISDNVGQTFGGGVYNTNGATFTLTNSYVFNNVVDSAGYGAGIYNAGELTIVGSQLAQNGRASNSTSVQGAYGGALYNAGNASIDRTTVTDNVASSEGAGIYNLADATLTLENSLLRNNVVNTSLIAAVHNHGAVALVNCTALDKLYGDQSAYYVYNSIVTQGAEGGEVNVYSSIFNGAFTNGENVVPYNPEDSIFANPNNGDYTLASDSVAINLGANEYVDTTLDLAGETRIVGSGVDLGAYEYQGATSMKLATPTLTVTDATVNSISVRWNAVPHATSYALEYKVGTNENYTVKTLSSSTTSYVIPNLASGTLYNIRILAVGTGAYENSDYSATRSYSTVRGKETPSLVVTTELDVVDAYDGLISLREAIDQYSSANDTITFANSMRGKTITLASQLEITKSLTIDATNVRDAINRTPSITLSGNNQTRVMWLELGDGTLTTNWLSFTNGVTTEHDDITNGAAVFFRDGAFNANNCVFTNNFAHGDGGAIDAQGALSLANCVFSNNRAGGVGGAIDEWLGSSNISNCTFTNNTAVGEGGALYVSEHAVATATQSALSGNVGSQGGAISTYGGLTVVNTELLNNSCAQLGGAIYNSGSATAIGCSINGNLGQTNGGGVYNAVDAILNMNDCYIANNTSEGAGGGVNNAGEAEFVACEFHENGKSQGGSSTRPNYGGALYNSGDATILQSSIVGNAVVKDGGGLYNAENSNLTIENSLLVGNVWGANGPDGIASYGVTTAINCTLIDKLYSYKGTLYLYNTIAPNGSSSGRVYVYNSIYNGSTTRGSNNIAYNSNATIFTDEANSDYTLSENSIAIDRGANNYVTQERDLADAPRIVGGTVDIGAYERQEADSSAALDDAFAQLTDVDWNLIELDF